MITSAEKTFNRLSSAIGMGKAFHAFFISCGDGAVALSLAKRGAALFCLNKAEESAAENFPDIHILNGEETGVKEIRLVIEELAKTSVAGGGRAIIIHTAHAMTREGQNALLKTLEEPPKATVFFLCGNGSGMLSTIISRCCVLRLGDVSKADIAAQLVEMGADEGQAAFYARIGGSLTVAAKLYKDEEYRKLRELSISTVCTLLRGELDSQAAKALAKAGAADALGFMLYFMGDVLIKSAGDLRSTANTDKQNEITACSSRFTTGRIMCIIDLITKANESLYMASGGEMYPAAVLDGLFLRIIKEITE